MLSPVPSAILSPLVSPPSELDVALEEGDGESVRVDTRVLSIVMVELDDAIEFAGLNVC